MCRDGSLVANRCCTIGGESKNTRNSSICLGSYHVWNYSEFIYHRYIYIYYIIYYILNYIYIYEILCIICILKYMIKKIYSNNIYGTGRFLFHLLPLSSLPSYLSFEAATVLPPGPAQPARTLTLPRGVFPDFASPDFFR